MKTSARALVLVLAVWLAACDTRATGSSPFPMAPTAATAPPPAAPPPAPPRVGGVPWSLTTTLTAATGGDACGLTFTPGTSARLSLILTQLADNRVTAVVAAGRYSTERYEYAGTLAGDVLSLTDGGQHGAMLCNGTRVDMDLESRVSGTIMDDGHALVGEEVETARLASGLTLTWHYEWRATFP